MVEDMRQCNTEVQCGFCVISFQGNQQVDVANG